MELNIIHLSHRKDRMQILVNELNAQGVINYKLWEGIWDRQNPTGNPRSEKAHFVNQEKLHLCPMKMSCSMKHKEKKPVL